MTTNCFFNMCEVAMTSLTWGEIEKKCQKGKCSTEVCGFTTEFYVFNMNGLSDLWPGKKIAERKFCTRRNKKPSTVLNFARSTDDVVSVRLGKKGKRSRHDVTLGITRKPDKSRQQLARPSISPSSKGNLMIQFSPRVCNYIKGKKRTAAELEQIEVD